MQYEYKDRKIIRVKCFISNHECNICGYSDQNYFHQKQNSLLL